MILELINTGTELMLGRILNAHQQWLCRELSNRGYPVARQTAVPDTAPAIQDAIRDALTRADWILTTGGLGPTSDDRTRELVAGLFNLPLHEDAEALARIRRFYEVRQRPLPAGVERQAQVPHGALVLQNDHGTAPGLVLKTPPVQGHAGNRSAWLVMLPGPPRELHPMFLNQVLPLLQSESPLSAPYACRTLRTSGIGESQAEERIRTPLASLAEEGLEIGYCARPGEVDLRFSAVGPKAATWVDQACAIAREHLGPHIYGSEDETLEETVIELLTRRGRTLATAESCTGGLLGHRLTLIPGASGVYRGGWITYSNESKKQELDIPADLLEKHGAVSAPIARAMAESARRRSGADYALAITGIAGPAGGTPEKPVGTVFIALAGPHGTVTLNPCNRWERATFKHVTTQQALDLLRRTLLTTCSETPSQPSSP